MDPVRTHALHHLMRSEGMALGIDSTPDAKHPIGFALSAISFAGRSNGYRAKVETCDACPLRLEGVAPYSERENTHQRGHYSPVYQLERSSP